MDQQQMFVGQGTANTLRLSYVQMAMGSVASSGAVNTIETPCH